MKKVWDVVKDYVYIVVAVLIIRTFIVTPAIVSGASMDNTLADGQLVVVNKFIYRFNDIKRFDIVVVDNESSNDKIIKRVIGLPNETIKYVVENDEIFKQPKYEAIDYYKSLFENKNPSNRQN